MDRAKRHALILELLAGERLANQEALLAALAGRGVRTTQATLSRDLRELGVLKGPAGYVMPGQTNGTAAQYGAANGAANGVGGGAGGEPEGGRGAGSAGVGAALVRALRGHLLSAVPGVGLVVCKTAPGHAQVVALELDRTPPEGVIGTVGGDDTVFVAVDAPSRVEPLTTWLLECAGLEAPLTVGGGL